MNTNDQLQTHIPDPSLLRVRALTLPTDKSKGFSVR